MSAHNEKITAIGDKVSGASPASDYWLYIIYQSSEVSTKPVKFASCQSLPYLPCVFNSDFNNRLFMELEEDEKSKGPIIFLNSFHNHADLYMN